MSKGEHHIESFEISLEILFYFGLLEQRLCPEKQMGLFDDYEYRKSPLFDRFMRFMV